VIYTRHLKERYHVIVGYAGTIFIGIALLLCLPLLAAVWFREWNLFPPFLLSAAIASATGLLLRYRYKVDSEITLTIQEGGIIVILAWGGAILFSALPFLFSAQLNFTQAFFESTSGWTSTGLTVVDVTRTPMSILLWRSIIQFVGGAGFSVMIHSAIIGPLGFGLFNAEGRSDKLLPNVTQSAKMITTILVSYTAAGVILYILAGMNPFDALNHSLTALSTAGFSTRAGSIGEFNQLSIELITIILMILGAVSFAAHYLLLNRSFRSFWNITELRLFVIVLLAFLPILIFFSLNQVYQDTGTAVRIGVFQLVSAITTTGFSTIDLRTWNGFSRDLLLLPMIFGGMAGATSGGIKMYRLMILIKSMVWNIRGYFLPRHVIRENAVIRPEGPYFLKKNSIIETTNFVTLYFLFMIFGATVIMLYGHSLSDALFETASAIGGVGLSVGITNPDAPAAILWSLNVLMLMGRLEFFVLFFASIKIVRDLKFLFAQKAVFSFGLTAGSSTSDAPTEKVHHTKE
jgi:trk system potassium uptake protein